MLDNQSADLFGPTPWQTVGPFFHFALPWHGAADLVHASALGARPDLIPPGHDLLQHNSIPGAPPGEAIDLTGIVLDGGGVPVPDALVEIWQADAAGRLAGGHFRGYGRCATSSDGRFLFRTIRPGRVVQPDGTLAAPHIAVGVLARGILKRLVTRIYFAGEAANASDAVLARVPEHRAATLLARHDGAAWVFDIVLQGAAETVFFQC